MTKCGKVLIALIFSRMILIFFYSVGPYGNLFVEIVLPYFLA